MSERVKAFVYVRVRDNQPDWILEDKAQSGTIAVAVPEFSEEWKRLADDRYAQEFGFSDADRQAIIKQVEAEAAKTASNLAVIEDLNVELASMETARNMLLEQDFQFAAAIDINECDGVDAALIDVIEDTSIPGGDMGWRDGCRFLRMLLKQGNINDPEGCDTPTTYPMVRPDWEGSFRIIQAQKTGHDVLAEAIAAGKHVLCAVPMAIGSRCLILDAQGEFGGAFEITMGEVKGYEKAAAYHLFADMRTILEKHADTPELRNVMGV